MDEADARSVARAIDALRRGWTIRIDDVALLPIETASADDLAAFDAAGPADLLISAARAETLKLTNQIDAAAGSAVRIARAPWIDFDAATAIADPALDLSQPLKGPFATQPTEPRNALEAGLVLARRAGLLPAFFVGGVGRDDDATVASTAVAGTEERPRLTIAARAKLPTDAEVQTEIIAFRSASEAADHIALLIGAPDGLPPLVRLHSECLTGDALGSLKCDCGPQLRTALGEIAGAGWGILLYLRQEGRGIGLVNKLRAYALQDQGFDTVDANIRLGFADDERDFAVAAEMLRLIGQTRIRLLTNNPRKVAALEQAGIAVTERVPHKVAASPHSAAYLATKRDRSGHQL